jgi:hypothetical protein
LTLDASATPTSPRNRSDMRPSKLFCGIAANAVLFPGRACVNAQVRRRFDTNDAVTAKAATAWGDTHGRRPSCLFVGGFVGCRHEENTMRSLIATVFSVAVLLSVTSGVFAQGVQPVQGSPPPQSAQPIPSTPPAQGAQPIPSATSEYSPTYEEHGRYHPCPSSVRFNGRSACLGCPDPPYCRVLPSDLTVH